MVRCIVMTRRRPRTSTANTAPVVRHPATHASWLAHDGRDTQAPMLPPRATISIVLSLMGTDATAGRSPRTRRRVQLRSCERRSRRRSFAFDLRPTVRWPAFRVSAHVRAGAEQARASGCHGVRVLPLDRRHSEPTRSRERARDLHVGARPLNAAGFWAIPRPRSPPGTGNEKSKLVYQGKGVAVAEARLLRPLNVVGISARPPWCDALSTAVLPRALQPLRADACEPQLTAAHDW